MKKILLGTAIILLVFLAGCRDKPTPEDRLSEYVSHWNKSDFAVMYENYLAASTKEAFPEEEFAARQEKLADDLGIENLEVTYDKPGEDTKWDKEQPAGFDIRVKMETLAGPVEFEKPITLRYEEREKEKTWFVEWDPSYIFPELEPGDEIGISRTEAKRGEIVDRAGIPIAKNGTGYQVGIVPEKLDEARKQDIAELLGTTSEAIDKSLNAAWVKPDLFVPIGKTAKDDTARLDRLIEIPGIAAREIGMREYPYGPALAHLTGYIGAISAEQLEKLADKGYTETDQIGRRGLESLLEDRLRGRDGMKITIKKEQEGLEPVTVAERAPEDGETVKLTIDAELQKVAYDAMKGEPGTAASIIPETGEVLTLVSSPAYNPNEFIAGMSGARYSELEEDEKTPLFNRFAQSYAPGSTIKPITAAIGMEAGTLDPAAGLTITGKTWQKDTSWGAYRVSRVHPEAPNPIDLNRAMVYSDNIYFAQQALAMGKDTLAEGLKQFGFGEPIPLEAMELKASQISNDGTIGSEGQLADTSFGQGQMLTNILHLASMYEPILTGGTMHKPTLLFDEEDGQVWKEGLVDPAHAETLRSTLRNVVVDGFAQSANLTDVPIAGKTGTAELKAAGEDRGKENGYFVSYHADNPAFILAMMVESVEDNGGSDYVAAMSAEVHRYAAGR
ncbi:penicillin-binding transpeptidase domain-containing protein [Bhargavaea ginsengi]|uniref:penicillin-binding transpeptidase domain-containing protein n=1 Tax=Bhargavaea ginsengi TaxID=426757 RepID=UPI00203DE571|nr:penicillin-binding transpeptidase domain-containing protein [Bhargavaea ginsengi]MCM3088928.1 penicillin-binding transpeptidase domain-containing protein [Bhargavaea ginsengi]